MSLSELALGSAGGARMESVRVATGAVAAAGAMVDVVVAWPTALPDANYTVAVAVEEATAGNTLTIRKIVSKLAASVTVRVVNNDALVARNGTLHAVAIVD